MAVRADQAEKTLREMRAQNTCKNIRSHDAFISNEGCGVGTIRSWDKGQKTYVKLPGGVLRDVFADANVKFAEGSGFRKSTRRDGAGESGLLREKDGTMIEYSQLNITEPRDLYIHCDAGNERCISGGELVIGRPGGHVQYAVGEQWDQLLGSHRVASKADPVSRAEVKRLRAAARAEAEQKKREEVAERKAIREANALAKVKAKIGRLEEAKDERLNDEYYRAALHDPVTCTNNRSVAGFTSNTGCAAGTIRKIKGNNYLKLPNGRARHLIAGQDRIGSDSDFNFNNDTRVTNKSMRYGVIFDCIERDCDYDNARLTIGRQGAPITYSGKNVMVDRGVRDLHEQYPGVQTRSKRSRAADY